VQRDEISVSGDVTPAAVVITAKVEGSVAAPALYQIREIGSGGDGPRPPAPPRARTWRDWVPRPLRTSGPSTRRGSNATTTESSNQLQPGEYPYIINTL